MTDRWLYLRLFHDDAAAADTILTDFVARTSHTMLANGSVDRFFFLRYFAGGHHIRYRLRALSPARVDSLHRWLTIGARKTSSISRTERASYEPELLKHGGPAGLEIAERQFFASSQLALSCIEATAADPERRTLVVAGAMDLLLRYGGLDRAARARCCREYAHHWSELVKHSTGQSIHTTTDLTQLEFVRSCIDAPDGGLRDAPAGSGAARWLEAVPADMAALRALAEQERLRVPIQIVLWNLVHTLANRLGLGIASEVAIARLAAIAYALPARPPRARVVDTDRPEQIWSEIADGLADGRPTVIGIDGDADPVLARWRTEAESMGARWVESPREEPDGQRPFALWRRLAERLASDGADSFDRRLAYARRSWSDPGCPMLPDPLGAHEVIADLLISGSNKPTVAVLRDVARASPDCLDAIATTIRRATQGTAVLLFVGDLDLERLDDTPGQRWTQLLRRLSAQAGLHHLRISGGRSPQRASEILDSATSARVGLAMCRAGALATGVHYIATAIAGDERHGSDPELLVHLAMATLQLRERDLAAEAAEAAYRAGPGPHYHRARRVWMATMHGNADTEGLDRFNAEIRNELKHSEASSPEVAWLLLDAALSTALRTDRRPEHIRYLDEILTRPPTEVPDHCLAIAHIWRAAPAFTEGRLADALPHQVMGVRLLETLADPTRLLFSRLRLGGTLWQLGQFAKAAQLFEQVTTTSLTRGDFNTALDSAIRAVLSHIEAEQPDAASELLHRAQATTRYMWSRRPSQTLLCELVLALARGEQRRARTISAALPPSELCAMSLELPPGTAKRMKALLTERQS